MRIRGYAPATPCWAVLATQDASAAADFYCGLFGWEQAAVDSGWGEFRLHDMAVAGLAPAAAPGQPPAWIPYVATEDAAVTAESAARAGGAVMVPPCDVGSRGRCALLADAEGAVFGAWQRGTLAGAQIGDEPACVCWNEVVVRDKTTAASFYGQVFDWAERLGTEVEGIVYTEWLARNQVVAGMSVIDGAYPEGTPAHWRVIFEAEDCAATMARSVELGGQVLMGPLELNVGTYAQIADPAGGSFGVFELTPELRARR